MVKAMLSPSSPGVARLGTLWTGRSESGASGRLLLVLFADNWLAIGVLFRVLGGITASDRAG